MIFKRQQSASKAAICSQAHAQSNLLTFGVHVPKLCLGFRLNLLLCLCVSQCILVRLLLTEPTKCSTGHMSYSLCRQQKIVKLPVPKNGTCLFSFFGPFLSTAWYARIDAVTPVFVQAFVNVSTSRMGISANCDTMWYSSRPLTNMCKLNFDSGFVFWLFFRKHSTTLPASPAYQTPSCRLWLRRNTMEMLCGCILWQRFGHEMHGMLHGIWIWFLQGSLRDEHPKLSAWNVLLQSSSDSSSYWYYQYPSEVRLCHVCDFPHTQISASSWLDIVHDGLTFAAPLSES